MGNAQDFDTDEDLRAKIQRDPVAPAQRSASAEDNAIGHQLPDGSIAHSFRTLLEELSAIVRSTCRVSGTGRTAANFQIVTTPNAKQKCALDLLDTITKQTERRNPEPA